MRKNVASQSIGAQIINATTGAAFTGAVTVYVTGDNGTQAVGSVGSGACTHEGNGYHSYAPAQAETNYDHVAFTFTGTGAIPATVQVFTGFPQTGDSFARIGAPAGASVSADVAAVKVDTAAVKTKTDFLPSATAGAAGGVFIAGTNAATTVTTALTTTFTGNLTGSVASVTGAVGSVTGLTAANLDATISSRATPAQVNTEVVDALNVDAYAEPGQGAPAATATLAAKINYLYKAWRNKKTQTATTFSLFADDATTVDQKATVSDDATTATIGEIVTGP